MRHREHLLPSKRLVACCLAIAVLLSGCRGSIEEGNQTSSKRRAGTTEQAEGDEQVRAPPITKDRLTSFLGCEEEILELQVSHHSRVTEAYLSTAHAERMKRLGEAETTGKALAEVLRGTTADHRREGEEVDQKLREADDGLREELREQLVACGFDSFEEWEAFSERLRPLRRWRLNMRIFEQSQEAREQVKAQLNQALERGRLTKEQRDAQLAVFPDVAPPEPPTVDPPYTDSEIAAVESFPLDVLVPGTLRGG